MWQRAEDMKGEHGGRVRQPRGWDTIYQTVSSQQQFHDLIIIRAHIQGHDYGILVQTQTLALYMLRNFYPRVRFAAAS